MCDGEDAPLCVLFTDVVASTELQTRLGEPSARPILDALETVVRDAVHDHGGAVVKLIGDGVLATFRSPRRAVTAAVAMQRAVCARSEGSHVVALRVGVHAGEVLVRDGDVHGTAVNVAARIVARASAGQVLVSDVVRHLVAPGPEVVFVEHGTFVLKGVPGHWRLHEVAWDGSVAPPEPEVVTAPIEALEGRAAALRRLESALDLSLAGVPQLALVAGEAGIGKTTLARTLGLGASDRGAHVVWGVALDGDGAPPYWPWIQVLETLLDLVPDLDPAPELARLVRRLEPDGRGAEVSDPDQARFRLFDSVTSLLHQAASVQPLVVVLDDLHWADESTLRLLAFVARRPGPARLLVIGAYRDVDAAERSTISLFGELARLGEVTTLVGLEPDDVGILLAAVTGREPTHEVITRVHQRTGGNPFFVREVGRLFAAHGEATGVPDGVRELVERRVARLNPRCVDILGAAAVVGQETTLDLLSAVTRRSLADLLDPLDDAVRSRVLAEPSSPLGPYRFAHDLFRETLYARLPTTERTELHLRVADALDAIPRPAHPAEVAHHLVRAIPLAPLTRVRAASRKAAEHATAQLAYAEAVAHIERAVGLCELDASVDAQTRVDLVIALGEALVRAGRTDEAAEAFLHAIDDARVAGLHASLAAAVVGLQDVGLVSNSLNLERTALLREALDGLGTEDSTVRARLLAAVARHSVHDGSGVVDGPSTAIDAATEAVAVARRVGDPATLAAALLALHDTHWAPGTATLRLDILEEMLRAATEARDAEQQFRAHELRLTAYVELGNRRAQSELDTLVAMARRLRLPRLTWWATTRQAGWAILAGDLDEGTRLSDEGLRAGLDLGEPDAVLVHACQQFELALARGQYADLEPMVGSLPEQAYDVIRLLAEGLIAVGRGDMSGLARLVRSSLDIVADSMYGSSGTLVAGWLAQAIVIGHDGAAARTLYDALLPHEGLFAVGGGAVATAGNVSHHLGTLAELTGDIERAAEHLDDAIARHDELRARAWSARSRLCLGRVLADREPQRARQLLDTARTEALLLDLPSVTEEADAVLAVLDRATAAPEFQREGRVWRATYGGTTAHVADSKGVRDIARLIAAPGTEIHAAELCAIDEAGTAAAMLDRRALAEYRSRLVDLERDIDDAERDHDLARAERAHDERDAVLEELRRVIGLGGRSRRLGDPGERARKAVSARVRDAVARISSVHPELAEHLRATIVTGTFCSYRPEVDRQIGSGGDLAPSDVQGKTTRRR